MPLVAGVSQDTVPPCRKKPFMQTARRFASPPRKPDGRRVLVVDDNEINRAIARVFLEAEGFQVLEAENGLSGAHLQALDPCDIILMDIVMPEVDGIATTGMIRAAEAASGRPRVPILALTASATTGLLDRYVDVGMDGYLPRPFNRSDLLRLVTYWSAPPSGKVADMPVLDAKPLEDLSAVLPPGTFRTLVGDFVRLGLAQAADLQRAAGEGRHQDTVTLVHDLVGTAGNIGLLALSARARSLLRRLRAEAPGVGVLAEAQALAHAAEEGWHLVCKHFIDRSEFRTAS